MQTSSTVEMVTISRAEYERLQQENAQMEATRVRLEAERIKLEAEHARLEAKFAAREQEQAQVITSLTLQNEWLLEQLKLSKKKLFGRSSEQAEQMVMDQLGLTMNELEAYAFGTKSTTEKQISVKTHERKRQSGNVLDVVPEGTPTEVVEHRLPEDERICSACGSKLVEIGKEVRRSLMMKPAEFWVREDIYYTYACKNCEQETGEANIVKAAKEPALLPGSFASAEAVAYLAAQKFVMYSPLYRLESENIRVVGCWARARRKFDEALQTLPKEMQKDSPAAIGECYCSRLFKLEQALAELTPEERYEKRLEQEKPVLDALLS